MVIDKPKKTVAEVRKYRNHMKLEPAELNQLAVFDDLIVESENREELNQFRKAKKDYVKTLQDKHLVRK